MILFAWHMIENNSDNKVNKLFWTNIKQGHIDVVIFPFS